MVVRRRSRWRWALPLVVLVVLVAGLAGGSGVLLGTSAAAGAASAGPRTVSSTPGYWLVGADGGVFSFDEPFYGSGYSTTPNACSFSPQPPSTQNGADGCDAVGLVPGGGGYWLLNAHQLATGFGNARISGLNCANAAGADIPGATGGWVGVASSTSGGGYWLVSGNGAVIGCGDVSGPFGSTVSLTLDAPIVSMAPTPDRQGYWLVASDGGIFAFGDTTYFGSMGGQHLNAPIVGIASTSDGQGYWLVASDGGIFAFGDAVFAGSMGGQHLNASMTAIAANPSGTGYWTVAADGGVFAFGGAPYIGGMAGAALAAPVVAIASSPSFPGAPPCDPDIPGGNAPGLRPELIFVGCATSADQLSSITWSSWTATGATGTGTHAVDNCVPDCARGTFTGFPVTVQLSNPGDVGGLEVFRTISMTPTTAVGAPETVTDGPSGDWGWVAS